MSDDTMPEVEASRAPDATSASQADGAPDRATGDGTAAPRRRRRRGSRGGRNRKKNPAAVAANGSRDGGDAGDADAGDDEHVPHDYTDAAADRGLTTDDL